MILRRQVLGLPTQMRTSQETAQIEAEKKAIQAKIDAANEDNDLSSDSDDDEEDDGDELEQPLAAESGDGQGESKTEADEADEDQGDTTAAPTAPARMDALLRGDIPRAVYSTALEKTGNETAYALELMAVLRDFPRTAAMRDAAYADLGDCPESTAARCRRPTEDKGPEDRGMNQAEINAAIGKSRALFDDALAQTPTAELYEQYVEFVQGMMHTEGDTSTVCAVQDVVDICAAAHEAGVASKALYEIWIEETLRRCAGAASAGKGHYTEALSVAEKATTARATVSDGDLWLRRIALTTAMVSCRGGSADSSEDDAADTVNKTYDAALAAVQGHDIVRVLSTRINFCLAHGSNEDVQQAFAACIQGEHEQAFRANAGADAGEKHGPADTRAGFVDWTYLQFGIGAARSLYARLLRDSPVQVGYESLQRFIDLEMAQDTVNIACVRELFERAVPIAGHDTPGLWLEYARAERVAGDVTKLGDVYWMAVKTLRDPEPFVSQYRLGQIAA